MTGWRHLAACVGHDPELFFPDLCDTVTRAAAQRICWGCPVSAQCFAEAKRLHVTDGVWGGRYINHKDRRIYMQDWKQRRKEERATT